VTHTVIAPPSSVVKCLWGNVRLGVWGVVLVVCVCVGGVVLSLCVGDLLIFLPETREPGGSSLSAARRRRERLEGNRQADIII